MTQRSLMAQSTSQSENAEEANVGRRTRWLQRLGRVLDAIDPVDAAQRRTRAERARYRHALQLIRRDCGAVCAGYETCDHAACQSSYRAWALADAALPAGHKDPLA